jgi:PAT family beta-lactamase induction signal transducer AmpG
MGSESPDYRGWAGIRRAFATPAAVTMLFLGFASGLPFLLVGGTLSTWLRDGGVGLALIGLISFANFLYVLKFLWAPLIDRYALPFLGRRRGWLAAALLLLMAALAALALHGPSGPLHSFVALVALAAFAGATVDIVVDAYRIEIAPLEAQAALAATYTLGYRFGLILSGAGVLYIADLVDWTTAYLSMAALLVVPLLATLLAREPVDIRVVRDLDPVAAFVRPLAEFFQRNGIALAVALLAFVGLYKLPDQMLGVLAGPFYLDSGFTKSDIATVSKLFGVWVGITGAFLGGACVVLFGLKRLLVVAAIGVALSNLAFLLMAAHPGATWAFVTAILADNLAQGFAGVVLVAFVSGLTDRNFTATQYALLVSLANLPGKLVGGFSGFVVEAAGYTTFFWLSTVSVVPTLLLLAWLWRRLDGART